MFKFNMQPVQWGIYDHEQTKSWSFEFALLRMSWLTCFKAV